MNNKKLKIIMLQKEITVDDIARVLGISKAAVYKKIAGETSFSIEDIRLLKSAGILTNEEIGDIFFSDEREYNHERYEEVQKEKEIAKEQ